MLFLLRRYAYILLLFLGVCDFLFHLLLMEFIVCFMRRVVLAGHEHRETFWEFEDCVIDGVLRLISKVVI